MTFDEMRAALDIIENGVPEEIFAGLNGGIILSPETKLHPQGISNGLVINGEYHNEPHGLGRYIVIYYGSLSRAYGALPAEKQTEKLKEVLYHELTHHLENMAGDKSLEVKDAVFLEDYKKKHRK